MSCSVQNCSNDHRKATKSHGITFHQFPRQLKLRNAWLEALGKQGWEPKERSTICSEHFSKEDFYLTKGSLRKIKSGAIPVIMQDSSEDQDAPATLRVCRICLATDVKMCQMNINELDEMYEKIIGLMVCKQDCLPQRVCWECGARLRAAVALRSKAHRAHSILQDLIQDNSFLTLSDIKSVNRSLNDLTSTLVQKIYENEDYDIHIEENIKFEVETDMMEAEAPDDSMALDENAENSDSAETKPDIVRISEIKDENTNHEIYFAEYDDVFDDDDDKVLSEVCEVKEKKKKKPRVEKKEKQWVEKKEKPWVEKNVRVNKVADDTPESLTDRYRQSYARRRKPNDRTEPLDDSLFTIRTMTYEEQIQEVQKRQESSAYINAPYKCDVCFRGFLNKDRYTVHFVRHEEKSGAFECFICKTRLKSSGALRKHLTAQHTEQFMCKGCPFVTRNRGVARDHEKWHAGTKYQCHHCASEFTKVTTYLGHIRIKHASDFVCELCGFTFVSEKGIDVHKKKKHRNMDKTVPLEGPYCEVCEVKFISQEAHQRHLQLSARHTSDHAPNRLRNDSQALTNKTNQRRSERRPSLHPRGAPGRPWPDNQPEPNAPVTCEQCGAQLADLRLYAQHFRRMHPDKNRTKYPPMKTPAMCEQCGRIFQSEFQLRSHKWLHTGVKLHKCEHCSKSFSQSMALTAHINRKHTAGSKPSYRCHICGKTFSFSNNRQRHMLSMALLKDHMWVHTGEKRFKCDRCPKSFTQKTNLVFHMRTHSATRPTYDCPLCGKQFSFYNNRRRHMFIHTGLKPFKCDTCGKCFTTSGEHRAHVDHVHMKKPWPKRARGRRDQDQGQPWPKDDVPTLED